jgi:acyl-CoA-binding protein
MHLAGCESETIDVEFVKFDSATFAETQQQPSEEKMLEHFQRFKDTYAGDVSEENPYGFGYKLPDMVQFEYMAVKLDDISPIIAQPTAQETEDYYRKHTSQFTESVPQDPNDPNSPLAEKTRSYAEVSSIISKQLLHDKINSKAESILQQGH